MTSAKIGAFALLTALIALQFPSSAVAADGPQIAAIVTHAVRPLMAQYRIPGMAVGITLDGRHYVFDYGVASKQSGRPITLTTLFEIGSISKTFTGSLVSYSQQMGKLALSDVVSADFPLLRRTNFDRVRLLNLGTYTAGGLPLQFPADVRSDEDAIRYYQRWRAPHSAGTYRLYSNPSIMLLGVVAANRLHAAFASLMQRIIFSPLGLQNTYLVVPKDKLAQYAVGYTNVGQPTRMSAGPLALEAYGIRTTALDLLRFIDANVTALRLDGTLQRAIDGTHTGYYRIGMMTQDLVWEQYRYPVTLAALLKGNSDDVVFKENKVVAVEPQSARDGGVIINKTGSTKGFAAYVAFIPKQKLGLVLLANKALPISARVTVAYHILAGITSRRY